MHGNDVHEALYQNYEIYGSWIRDSGPRVYFLPTITFVGDKVMHFYYVHSVLMINSESHGPKAMWQKLRPGRGCGLKG